MDDEDKVHAANILWAVLVGVILLALSAMFWFTA